jgi:deoxyribonuclease IV
MLLGAHVSIAGGIDTAIDRGNALGVQAIQTFASSPRTIHFSPLDKTVISKYLAKRQASQIKLHVFHGVYLLNLAHENPDYVKLCVESLKYYQDTAAQINGLGTIFHVGSHKGKGLAFYLPQIAQAIAAVLESSPPQAWLLLENAAGQAGTIGQHFSDLKIIIDAVSRLGVSTEYLGIGVDSQHAFASGYDLREVAGLNQLVHDIDSTVGLNKLQILHVNDSLVAFDSNRDRHANLGEGEIGRLGLSYLINHPQLHHLPMILEVPGDKQGPRRQDVNSLAGLVKPI